MTNYEGYCAKIISGLQDILGTDYTLKREKVSKNNGTQKDGLIIQKSGESFSPVVYLDELYAENRSLAEIASTIYQAFSNFRESPTMKMLSLLTDFEKIRSRVILRLVNYSANAERLKSIAHIKVLDMAAAFYLFIGDGPEGLQTAAVSNDLLKSWGVSFEEFYPLALGNMERIMPPVRTNFLQIMKDIGIKIDMKSSGSLEHPFSDLMHILTNRQMVFGAASILYPSFLKKVSDELEDDLILLPSSVHEFIALPDMFFEEDSLNGFAEMVKEINFKEVSDTDKLSDNAYRYVRDEDAVYLMDTDICYHL